MGFTSAEVVGQAVQDARDFFDAKGSRRGANDLGDVFGIVPEDNNEYCQCENCLALMDETGRDNPQFSNGKWIRLVWTFVNRVSREDRIRNSTEARTNGVRVGLLEPTRVS